ncbi:MAG: DeoR family transcriptional regulator, partial [Lacticaseibacillus paracasei]|nr:DeoR family transcriptional regulator [Lacticaseibacillus paracasei]
MSQKPAKFERLNDIIRILRETPQISVAELSRQIFTSKSTLRRDLIELENTNIIQRQYGMIQLLQCNNIEFTYEKLRNENARLKRIISHQIA